MHRVLSWKRLLIVVGVFVVLSASAFGVYRVQVKRHAAILKERALKEEAAAGGDTAKTDEAVTLYARYLKFRPRDEEAYTRYANLMIARATANPKKSQAAADAVAAFLRQFPEHPDERRKVIDIYIRLGFFNTAREHLTVLFNAPGGKYNSDPELCEAAATCEEFGGNILQAVTYLDTAIESGNAPLRTFERILGVLQSNPSFNHIAYPPNKYLEWLVLKPPYSTDVAARALAARGRLARKEPEFARDILRAAEALPGAATHADFLLASAQLALSDASRSEKDADDHFAKARVFLERAFDADPKDVRIGLLLSNLYANARDTQKGVAVLKKTAEALGEPNDQFQLVVDRLIDYGDTELSTQLVERMATNERDKARMVKYYRGRLAVVRKDWAEARKLLEEVAPVVARVPEFHKKAFTGLAECYAVFQNPDKQLEYSRGALKDDPSYLPALVAEAEALAKLGKVRDALPRYHALVVGFKLESFRPTLVRLELVNALLMPAGVRKWATFEDALGAPEKRTAEIHIIHAEALAAQGKNAAATELLQKVVKDDPKNSAAWLALARVRDGGRPEATLAALDTAKTQVGDSLDLRLARAGVLATRAKRPTPQDFRDLATDVDKFGKGEQHRLWFGLGEATMRATASLPDAESVVAMRTLSIEFFEKAAAANPLDVVARAILIDLGLAAGDKALVEKALAQIAQVEGEKGPIGTLGRVAARLPEVRKMEDKAARAAAVRELRADAKKARDTRPAWSRIYIALAQLDEIEGLNESALLNYREALDKGDRQEFVIRRTVELYRERKQDDTAALLLNSLAGEVNLPDDLERFRAIKELLSKDVPKSERATIERIAPLNSPDYRIRLLRGALLAAIREDKDAEIAFRAAVAVGEHVPDTWTALVTHLTRQQKTAEAKAAIAEAETKLRAKPLATEAATGELLVSLASCYEIVGDLKTAAERYQQAVQAAPKELSTNRQWIRFLQRHGQQAAAQELLKKLTDSPAQDLARWGRRTLAMSYLVGRKAYLQRFAALNLIEQNLKTDPDDLEDRKAKAVVQTIDPLTRDEGMNTLKEHAKRYELTPEEFYLLARLYFDQGRIPESLDYFDIAARPQPGVTLQHLSGLIRVNLAMNRVEAAARVLERLKTAAPASWEAARDEALVLNRMSADAEKVADKEKAKKLREQARDAVVKYPGSRGENFVARELGPALEELGFTDDAEAAYASLLDDQKTPSPHLPLCVFLIHQKRTDQVIKLAKQHAAKAPVVVTAQLLSGAVRAKNPGGESEKFVEDWLEGKLREYAGKPELPALVAAKAELLDAQGKYDAAIAEYRRSIDLDAAENSDFVKNNLATLIALHKPAQVDEAIKLMTDVIGIRGPAPAFLDTRAVAYLVKGTPDLAVKDLELALAQQRKALYLFHLGWAYDLIQEKRSVAGKVFDEARQLGMKGDALHPLELKKFGPRYGLGGK